MPRQPISHLIIYLNMVIVWFCCALSDMLPKVLAMFQGAVGLIIISASNHGNT